MRHNNSLLLLGFLSLKLPPPPCAVLLIHHIIILPYYHIIILSYYIYIIWFYMHLYYLHTALASLNYSRQDKSCLTQSAGASSRTSPFTTLGVQQPGNSGAPKYRTGQPIKIQIRKKICRVQRLTSTSLINFLTILGSKCLFPAWW